MTSKSTTPEKSEKRKRSAEGKQKRRGNKRKLEEGAGSAKEEGKKKRKKKENGDAEENPSVRKEKRDGKERAEKREKKTKRSGEQTVREPAAAVEEDVEPLDTTAADQNDTPEASQNPASKKISAPADESVPTGHLLILQKLRRSLAIARANPTVITEPEPGATTGKPDIEPVAATGLEPLPQPELTKASKPISILSSLPPWLKEPISVSPTNSTPFPSITGLSTKLQQRLSALSLTEAFAVQTSVLPLLLETKTGGDLCISAATGSGKTLAYVLPIIQSLSSRVVTRLRAIIVVPTRELVQQVNSTAISISSGTGLKIGTAVGSRSLVIEQGLLVAEEDDGSMVSKLDILITTPGRLVEHVRATPGFDLTWVKWLVIDEADRLLAQSFQEWVNVVIVGLEEAAAKHRVNGIAGVDLGNLGLRSGRREGEKVRKVVLSATMTRDVGKLAGLRLRRPRLVVVEDPPLPEDTDVFGAVEGGAQDDEELEQFSVPAGLREHVTPVESIENKPLYLLYLLRLQDIKTGALVFVKSNEGAARLAKLLETVGEKSGDKFSVGLVTGEMEKKRREKILKRFAKGEVDM